eukprot:scaffold618202_cov110-Attheya_sp.AAC.3
MSAISLRSLSCEGCEATELPVRSNSNVQPWFNVMSILAFWLSVEWSRVSLSLSCECRKAQVCVFSLSLSGVSFSALILHAASGTTRRFLAESIQ